MSDAATVAPLRAPEPEPSAPDVAEAFLGRDGESPLPAYLPHLPLAAHTKRFFERWLADESFRSALLGDPAAAQNRFGLEIDPAEIQWLWDDECRNALAQQPLLEVIANASPASKQLLAWIQTNHEYRRHLRADSRPDDPAFAAWRERQIARASTAFRPAYD